MDLTAASAATFTDYQSSPLAGGRSWDIGTIQLNMFCARMSRRCTELME